MDSDSDFGFGGSGDDDASFTPSLEEEEQQQDKNIVPATVTPTTQKKKRRRFSLQEKLCLLWNVRRRIHNGLSQAAACHSLNVHEKQVIEWKKQFQALKHSSNKKAKSLCKGRSSILVPLTDPLLSFIFELCETGMAVSINIDTIYIKTQVFRLLRYYSPAPRNIARSDWATQNITHNMTSSKT